MALIQRWACLYTSSILTYSAPALLAPKKLPGLWSGDEITVKAACDYFGGATVVQVDRNGYQEPMQIRWRIDYYFG